MKQDLGFYSTAAQVIPVLLLAFALDVRYSGRNYTDNVGEWMALCAFGSGVVVLALGEVVALKVLDAGQASATDHAIVVTALGLGGVLLLMEVLISRTTASRLWHERTSLVRAATMGVVSLAVVLALVAVFAV